MTNAADAWSAVGPVFGILLGLAGVVLEVYLIYLVMRYAAYRGAERALWEAGLRKTPWPPPRPAEEDEEEWEESSDEGAGRPGTGDTPGMLGL
jgi:hypothetical protein